MNYTLFFVLVDFIETEANLDPINLQSECDLNSLTASCRLLIIMNDDLVTHANFCLHQISICKHQVQRNEIDICRHQFKWFFQLCMFNSLRASTLLPPFYLCIDIIQRIRVYPTLFPFHFTLYFIAHRYIFPQS